MNIKDSYIHGDQAVVRSIEGLSVSGTNLVLTYKKADSGSTQETKTIAISSFNSALSNKFVTLDTVQTVSGKKTFSNGTVVQNGLLFDKGGTTISDEVFHIDGSVNFTGNNGSFTIKSTQGWAGFKAMVNNTNLGYLAIQASDKPTYISADQNTVRILLHSGNYTTYTPIINGSHASSSTSIYSPTSAGTSGQLLVSTAGTPEWKSVSTIMSGSYLPLSGGTMTGDLIMNSGSYPENILKLVIKRKKDNAGGGWAYNPIQLVGNDGNSFAYFGSFGDNNIATYMYLGLNGAYNSDHNLRIYSDKVTFGSNTILHAGNTSFSSQTLSWGSSKTFATVNGTTYSITLPSNPNTDYQVKQSNKTDNVYYPILLGGNYNATASSIATSDKTSQVYQNSGVYVNASTKTIYASTFSGSFSGNSTTSTQTKYTLTSSAYHLVGVNENLTSTATARSSIGRNDVLVTASGAIQSVDTAGFNLGTSATMKYNTTNQSIDFIFN